MTSIAVNGLVTDAMRNRVRGAFAKPNVAFDTSHDEGSQNETWMCEACGNILIRGGNPLNPAFNNAAPRRASMGHISFGIDPFDADGTKAELDKRGLTARPDIGRPGDIHEPTALYKSYHTTTPMGFDLQISNATKANRTVRQTTTGARRRPMRACQSLTRREEAAVATRRAPIRQNAAGRV